MLDNVKEIHIEPTSVCNAECPMCARNINGKGLNPFYICKRACGTQGKRSQWKTEEQLR